MQRVGRDGKPTDVKRPAPKPKVVDKKKRG